MYRFFVEKLAYFGRASYCNCNLVGAAVRVKHRALELPQTAMTCCIFSTQSVVSLISNGMLPPWSVWVRRTDRGSFLNFLVLRIYSNGKQGTHDVGCRRSNNEGMHGRERARDLRRRVRVYANL